jgi:hypothetical protein
MAWHDGAVDALVGRSNYAGSSCTDAVGLTCTRTDYADIQFNDFIQYGVCLAETTVLEETSQGVPATNDHLMQTQNTQALATLTHVDLAAVSAMKNACAAAVPTPTSTPTRTPRPKPTPTQPAKPSLTVNPLSVTDLGGHTRHAFRKGQHFLVKATWHAKHMAGAREADLSFTLSPGQGAKGVTAVHLHEQVPSASGVNHYTREFQIVVTGTWRISVRITVGSRTKSRSVIVHVTR